MFFASAGVLVGDTLSVGSTVAKVGVDVVVPVDLLKENAVVGVQFKLRYPAGLVESGHPLVLSNSSDHGVTSTDDTEGVRGVVVFSKSNAEMPNDFSLGLPLVLGEGTPAGGPSVSVEEIIFTDAGGNAIASSTAYTLVEAWRRANFDESEWNNPDVAGDDADPDGDGVSNIGELGEGLDPNRRDARGEGAVDVEVGGDGKVYVTVKFWRSNDPAVRAAAPRSGETSADLAVWTEAGVTVEPTGVSDATGEEAVAKAEVGVGDLKRFVRVRTRRATGQ